MPVAVLLKPRSVVKGPALPSDVPGIYDIIINGRGYIFANAIDPNIPFRTQRARFGYTPTFIERTNTSGDYGDNQQDFWLTVSMRDWSLGDGQKFYRSQDTEKARQFWFGTNLNVSIGGQASIALNTSNTTVAAATSGAVGYPANDVCYTASSTNLYEVASNGSVTDRGAHGVGAQPTAFATDGSFVYLSYGAGSKVRKFDMGAHTFADFSSQPANSLAYLNNTLYGVQANNLYSYDTGGSATNQFPYKTATGAALSGTMQIVAFGGKVIILRNSGTIAGAELWEFDGTGVAKLAEYPGNFAAAAMCVCSGVLFVAGLEGRVGDGYRTAIWYYANGNIGRAYADPVYGTAAMGTSITAFGNGLLFGDSRTSSLRFYDLSTGGVSVVATSLSGTNTWVATGKSFALFTNGSTTTRVFPSSTVDTQATLETSIVDFESSLSKMFRGAIVDYVADADATIDIYYQLNDVDGSWTLLQAEAISGNEYPFPDNTLGRGVALKLVMKANTSLVGPLLKRIYVRAAPTLSRFRNGEYIIDCTGGANGTTPVQLRNGTSMPLTGQQLCKQLLNDATSGALLAITDHISTYSGIIELENMDVVEVRPQEYYARFTTREV